LPEIGKFFRLDRLLRYLNDSSHSEIRMEGRAVSALTEARRLGVVLFAAGLAVVATSHAAAQSLATERARDGRLEYTVTFTLNNTSATAVCGLEVQIASPGDEISSKISPGGWSAAGPENGAVAWEASNAGNCVPPGVNKSGFGLHIDGVLPVDLHVCFADQTGKTLGSCQAIRIR
jgi:hypothetical protein